MTHRSMGDVAQAMIPVIHSLNENIQEAHTHLKHLNDRESLLLLNRMSDYLDKLENRIWSISEEEDEK